MLGTFRKVAVLIGPGQRGRWVLVIALAIGVGVFEAAGTLLVFTLLGLLVGAESGLTLPIVGDVADLAPDLARSTLTAWLGLGVAVFFVVRSFVILAQNYLQFRLAENAGARLSGRLLEGYLTMPWVFHLQHNSAELIRTTFHSTAQFVGGGLVPAVQLLSKIAIVVGVGTVLLVMSPLATMFTVAILGPLLWGLLRLVHPRVQRLGRVAQEMAKNTVQALQQTLHGVRDIVLLGRGEEFIGGFLSDRQQLARVRYLQSAAVQIPRVGMEMGVVLSIVALLGVTTLVGGATAEVVPLLGLFGYAALRVMPELNIITSALNSLKFVGPAIDDLYEDIVSAQEAPKHKLSTPLSLRREIALEGVSFVYPGAAVPAVSDIEVVIRAGQSVGIVGPTGGGKTTLVDLVIGLLEPTEGRVRVDGVDIRDRLRDWQANLGVVSQMVFLTDDSLRRNVALGIPDDEIDEELVWEALRLAQAEGFVRTLPEGLDTCVGERGVRVSGGQRQRLAIARALYRQPAVLVFDEGTSALDSETEAALMAALEHLREGRTLLTVAHRLTTVAACDKVMLLKDGRVADVGSYADIIARHPSLGAGAA